MISELGALDAINYNLTRQKEVLRALYDSSKELKKNCDYADKWRQIQNTYIYSSISKNLISKD